MCGAEGGESTCRDQGRSIPRIETRNELFDVHIAVTAVMKETASPSKCPKPNNFLAWKQASTCFQLGQGAIAAL